MTLPHNLPGIRKRIDGLAGNISASKALGAKEQQTLFNVSYADNGKVSYVESQTRLNITERGPLVSTGNRGDIALSKGNGMFVYKQNITDTSDREFRFSSTGSLRIDKDGYLSTSADGTGYKLMGYKIDENGNLPPVTSLLSSLSPVSIKDAILRPEATTTISVNRLRLDSDKTTLHGPGDVIKINRGALNANLKADDIIIPEENNHSSIKQGDRLQMLSTPPGGNITTFEYGGIAISKKINSGNGGFYQRTTTGGQFAFDPARNPAGTNLVRGDGINITFNGNITTLTADTNGADQTFSSLEGLKDAINKFIPGLGASIKDGRIFIAADDTADPTAANGAITFTDANGGNLVQTFGLIDVAPAVGVQRFATLKTLQKRVNLNNVNTGLKADFVGGTNLDLHSLIASSNLELNGHSAGGPYSFSRAKVGPFYVGDIDLETRATFTIEAPKHGLMPGDFVQITGTGQPADLPDGRYMVTKVSVDNFSIHPTDPDPAHFPLGAGAIRNGLNGTWQKIAGEVRPIETPTAAAAAAGGAVTIDIAAANTKYAVGDIVYISGVGRAHINAEDVDIPDGYYTLTVVNVGDIAFAPAATATANVYPAVNVGDIRVQKVGAAGSSPRVMTTIAAAGGAPAKVRLFLPHTNYNVGDYFRITGLPNNAPLVIDNMTITPGNDYQIINKDPAGNWIEFTPPITGGAPGGNVDSNYGAAAGTDVGDDFRIDSYSLTSKYLGLQNQTAKVFNATYSKTDPALSISNFDAKSSKHSGKIFDKAIEVVDSLGSVHELIMTFARLEDNHWAVEIAGVRNADGSYDFVTTRPDGVIQAGDLFFDEKGNFSNSTVDVLNIDWTTNGSLPSNITIDWNDLLDGKGITQFRGDSLAEEVKPNGHTIGTIENFDIDEDGKVYAIFDNGERIAVYQVPVAMAANMNGLEGTADGMFIPGPLSGPMQLRIAGENGAPTVISKAYEGSNIDSLNSILELNETSNAFRANVAVLTTEDTLTKEAIAKVGSV